MIAYKNERLPVADAPNQLQRVAIDFSTDSLEENLAPFAERGGPVVVVVEGVFMYLEQQAIEQLLQTLRRLFPQHKLICDLMTRKFFEKYGRTIHEKLTGMGATFKFTVDNPAEVFVKHGYERLEQISTVVKSTEFEGRKVPKILFRTFLRTLASGYAIYVFETR